MRTRTTMLSCVAMFLLGACVDAGESDPVNAPEDEELVSQLSSSDFSPPAELLGCPEYPCPPNHIEIYLGEDNCDGPYYMPTDQCREGFGKFQGITRHLLCLNQEYPWDMKEGKDHGRVLLQCGY